MKMGGKNTFLYLSMMLAIGLSIELVSSDGGTGGGNSSHQQSGGGGGGEGGEGGSGGSLTVVVSYESFNSYSQDFFKSQLTSHVLEELSQCNIDFKIYPCATSKMVMEKLKCWNGEVECAADRIYACATKLNESNMKAVGKFVICLMNAGSAQSSGQKCATQASLAWDTIDACSKTVQADKNCQRYWGIANDDLQMLQLPSVMVPPKYVDSDAIKAKNDFKGFVCKKLKEKHMSCPACGGSSGGGGEQGHHSGGGSPSGSGCPSGSGNPSGGGSPSGSGSPSGGGSPSEGGNPSGTPP